MNCTICNPILLRSYSRWVNNKLHTFLVKSSCCLHHYCIISISQLSETKTSSNLQPVYFLENLLMSLSVKSYYWSTYNIIWIFTKKIIMYSKFCCCRSINHSNHLVGSKNICWIMNKIFDRYNSWIGYFL